MKWYGRKLSIYVIHPHQQIYDYSLFATINDHKPAREIIASFNGESCLWVVPFAQARKLKSIFVRALNKSDDKCILFSHVYDVARDGE